MAYGFRAENNLGIVQIDGNYTNYVVDDVYTAPTQWLVPVYSHSTFLNKMEFVRPSLLGNSVVADGQIRGPGRNDGDGYWENTPPANGEYVVTIPVNEYTKGVTGNWGLQVLNVNNNEVAYDSRIPYMAITHIEFITINSNNFTTRTIDLPAPKNNKKYYVYNGANWTFFSQSSPLGFGEYDNFFYVVEVVFVSNTQFTLRRSSLREMYVPGAGNWSAANGTTIPIIFAQF